MIRRPPSSPLFPATPPSRSVAPAPRRARPPAERHRPRRAVRPADRRGDGTAPDVDPQPVLAVAHRPPHDHTSPRVRLRTGRGRVATYVPAVRPVPRVTGTDPTRTVRRGRHPAAPNTATALEGVSLPGSGEGW